MLRTSRYGRPVLPADLDNLNTALANYQGALSEWLDTHGTDPVSEHLADAGEELSNVLTELIVFALAPSAHRLIIIK